MFLASLSAAQHGKPTRVSAIRGKRAALQSCESVMTCKSWGMSRERREGPVTGAGGWDLLCLHLCLNRLESQLQHRPPGRHHYGCLHGQSVRFSVTVRWLCM